jgi:hypothetical protein
MSVSISLQGLFVCNVGQKGESVQICISQERKPWAPAYDN